MPVQDNEIPKAEEQIFENEDEKLKQAVQNSQENSTSKSQKLLPFLNAKAEFHQNRIDTLNEKIATREDKIARNEAKIEKLSAKADRLEDRNTMLKNTLGNLPGIKKLIESNEKKIESIRENKIPKRQQKIERHKDKIAQFNNKRDGIEHKQNRVLALNDVVKSFSIGLNKERREVFSNAMDRLNKATIECLNDKKNSFSAEKTALVDRYNDENTTVLEKLDLQNDILSLNKKITSVDSRIDELTNSEALVKQPDEVVNKVINDTEITLNDMAESETISIPNISDTILNNTMQSMEQTLDKII